MTPGTRVRLLHPCDYLTFPSLAGEIVGPDPTERGRWIVRLDQPAVYYDPMSEPVFRPRLRAHERYLEEVT